jgi:hypothetical protein
MSTNKVGSNDASVKNVDLKLDAFCHSIRIEHRNDPQPAWLPKRKSHADGLRRSLKAVTAWCSRASP